MSPCHNPNLLLLPTSFTCASPVPCQPQQLRPKGIRQQVQLPLLQYAMQHQRLEQLLHLLLLAATAAAAALSLLLLPLVLPLYVLLAAWHGHDDLSTGQDANC
jgi:hypothetical protein